MLVTNNMPQIRFSSDHPKTCPLCSAEKEEELHFLLGCNKLGELRIAILLEQCLENRHSRTVTDIPSLWVNLYFTP